jgi:glucokinase
LNDYTAFAQRLLFIGDAQCIKLGSGSHRQGFSKAIFGPGTELGISAAVAIADFWVPQIFVNALSAMAGKARNYKRFSIYITKR